MSEIGRVVIVGGGLGGANTAFALRERGFDGAITIVGDEDELPYERPPLSKTYLRGEEPLEKAYVKPAQAYEEQRIGRRAGTSVTAIDSATRRIETSAGTLEYDALVLATGSRPRRLPVPGAELEGVYYLRNVGDADALRSAALKAEKIVVIGGGFIGSEVAASLRQLGRNVTVLMTEERPLERVIGPEVAEVYRAVHAEHEVRLVQGMVTQIDGDTRVSGVRTADGQQLAADMVVIGIGAQPRTEIAAAAGLTMSRETVLVDEHLATSAVGVWAVGDIVSAYNPRYGTAVHVEHWDNAIRQGKAAAANIVGQVEAYDRAPYFYSDQYDLGMEYRGYAPTWDEVIVRGDLDARQFHAFWLAGGRIAAAMNVNLWDDGDELSRLVDARAEVDRARLADTEVALADLG